MRRGISCSTVFSPRITVMWGKSGGGGSGGGGVGGGGRGLGAGGGISRCQGISGHSSRVYFTHAETDFLSALTRPALLISRGAKWGAGPAASGLSGGAHGTDRCRWSGAP